MTKPFFEEVHLCAVAYLIGFSGSFGGILQEKIPVLS